MSEKDEEIKQGKYIIELPGGGSREENYKDGEIVKE